ncbi:exodeoxyribonuclease VII small subunit [Candidatus Latescibacterota bacterium]
MNDKNENNSAADLFETDEDNPKNNENSFESVLGRLEEIVEQMESGGLGLEKSMKLYEEGTKKIGLLSSMLEGAREKVMKLVSDSEGKKSLEIFEGEDSD